MEDSDDDDDEPIYVGHSLSGEEDVIMKPDSGDESGEGEDEEDEESELSRSKKISVSLNTEFYYKSDLRKNGPHPFMPSSSPPPLLTMLKAAAPTFFSVQPKPVGIR